MSEWGRFLDELHIIGSHVKVYLIQEAHVGSKAMAIPLHSAHPSSRVTLFFVNTSTMWQWPDLTLSVYDSENDILRTLYKSPPQHIKQKACWQSTRPFEWRERRKPYCKEHCREQALLHSFFTAHLTDGLMLYCENRITCAHTTVVIGMHRERSILGN